MNKMILLIPGNPSVPGIYDPFANQVASDLTQDESVFVRVLPHLGQCNESIIKRNKIDVFDVIADHKETIVKLVEKHRPDEVILIGHSLGSAVSIALHQELGEIVNHFIILCPFTGPSKNNIRYLKMFANPITGLGMKAISYSVLSNKPISHKFFKRWLGDNPFNELIPEQIKKPLYIKNFFLLVSTYIRDFERLQIKDKLKEMNPAQTYFIFAENDYWVPAETIEMLPKAAEYRICEGISHDFCLRDKEWRVVSSAIASHLLKNKVENTQPPKVSPRL